MGRAFATATLGWILATAGAARAERPLNVVLIVADDLGYSDLGAYGGEIDTPHIDRLAREGVRFTQFYATPRCSPSRAALLTGMHPHAVGVGHLNRDWGDPAYRGSIRGDVRLLPERLGAAGYRSYMAGKWHLAPMPRRAAEEVAADTREAWPMQRGFDAFFGTLRGSGSYFQPSDLMEGNERAEAEDGFYLTDVLGERAAAFLAEHRHREPDRPFFLYLALTAPHWPLHATEADIARFQGRFDDGWDRLREARLARMKEEGIVAATAELAPRAPGVPLWRHEESRDWQLRRMEVYAAMVYAMDRAVGRVLEELRTSGALERTLVVFTADNGASDETMRGLNRLLPFFVPIPTETPAGDPVRFGDAPDIEPGGPDTFAAYGRGWAQLSNTPFGGFKKTAAEGGIAVPLIVRWPGAAAPGSLVHDAAHVVDLVPTVLDLADIEAPAPDSEAELPGRSLRTHLEAPASRPDRPSRTLFWEHEGNRAVLRGSWKLVARWPFPPRLYDLDTDRGEADDLAADHPDLVAELDAAWNEWAAAVGVRRWPFVVPGVTGALAVAALLLVLLALRGRGGGLRGAQPPASQAEGPVDPR